MGKKRTKMFVCRECGKRFDLAEENKRFEGFEFPYATERPRDSLEDVIELRHSDEDVLCADCLMKRINKAWESFQELAKKADDEYRKLERCEVCDEPLYVTDDGVKFCKSCDTLYLPLDMVSGEIEEKVCSLLPSYENACERLCPIGYTECPLTSENWEEDRTASYCLSEEEIKKAKKVK
jgi:hypothetical protein